MPKPARKPAVGPSLQSLLSEASRRATADLERVLGDALEVIRLVAVLVSPAMPSVASELWRRLGLAGSPTDEPARETLRWGRYPGGIAIEKGVPLFPRINEAR